MSVAEELRALVDQLEGRVPAGPLGAARQQIRYREYGVALENLCENLFDAGLSVDDIGRIRRAAEAMGLDPARWEFVTALAEDST